MRVVKELYTSARLYAISIIIIFFFVVGHFFDPLFFIGKFLLLLFALAIAIDFYLLFFVNRQCILLRRELPQRFSNGDENPVKIYIKNMLNFSVDVSIVDEIPVQFQVRDFNIALKLQSKEEKNIDYVLKPVERGEYEFGRTNAFISSPVNLLKRRLQFGEKTSMVKVYPSYLKMRKYELLAISNKLTEAGVKRIRRIGTHTEFDQIKDYIKGDNYRTINWKATAKRAKLMVNQYQEERAQQVYSLIDMGRVMKMPFEGMSLLDYAINSSLVISNTAMFKHDKPGIVTFNDTVNTYIAAEKRNNTIHKILEALYNQKTFFNESDFEYLAIFIKKYITHRSLLILYTNFESIASLQRYLQWFKNIAKTHLLLVVVFENTEIDELLAVKTKNLQEVYQKAIAEKFMYDKKLIIKELNKNGILGMLTKPELLSTNLINKYLELKNVGMI